MPNTKVDFPLVEYPTEWRAADGGGKFTWRATFDLRQVMYAMRMFDGISKIKMVGDTDFHIIGVEYDDLIRDWNIATQLRR